MKTDTLQSNISYIIYNMIIHTKIVTKTSLQDTMLKVQEFFNLNKINKIIMKLNLSIQDKDSMQLITTR